MNKLKFKHKIKVLDLMIESLKDDDYGVMLDKVTGRIICMVKDCDKSATFRFKASHSGTIYGYCDKHFANT